MQGSNCAWTVLNSLNFIRQVTPWYITADQVELRVQLVSPSTSLRRCFPLPKHATKYIQQFWPRKTRSATCRFFLKCFPTEIGNAAGSSTDWGFAVWPAPAGRLPHQRPPGVCSVRSRAKRTFPGTACCSRALADSYGCGPAALSRCFGPWPLGGLPNSNPPRQNVECGLWSELLESTNLRFLASSCVLACGWAANFLQNSMNSGTFLVQWCMNITWLNYFYILYVDAIVKENLDEFRAGDLVWPFNLSSHLQTLRSMPGSVFVGQGLRVGSVPAVVVRFDRTGVVAAALDVAEAGASVTGRGYKMRSPW